MNEIAMGLCNDDRIHAFPVLADGVGDTPFCGSAARFVRAGSDSDYVCTTCADHVVSWAAEAPLVWDASIREWVRVIKEWPYGNG